MTGSLMSRPAVVGRCRCLPGNPTGTACCRYPPFLLGHGVAGPADIVAGLTISGYFLQRHIYSPQEGQLPDSRDRLLHSLRRMAAVVASNLDD